MRVFANNSNEFRRDQSCLRRNYSKMKSLILILTFALTTSATQTPRDKRSFTHTQAYPVPVSVHTVVRPSNTLPVYEYPESTQIDTHAKTVYTVSVPITHTVTLEQPSHSRQIVYHAPPADTYQPQAYQHYQPQVYTPQVYHVPRTVYRTRTVYAPSHPWVYQRHGSTWC